MKARCILRSRTYRQSFLVDGGLIVDDMCTIYSKQYFPVYFNSLKGLGHDENLRYFDTKWIAPCGQK
jgi:hypothetical protein